MRTRHFVNKHAVWILTGVVLFQGASDTFRKILLTTHGVPSEWVVTLQYLLISLSMLFLTLIVPRLSYSYARELNLRFPREYDFWKAVLSGVLVSGAYFCYVKGVDLLPASQATVCIATLPIWCQILAFLFLREKLILVRLIASVIALSGIGSIVVGDIFEGSLRLSGLLWVFGGVFLDGFSLVIVRDIAQRYSGMAMWAIESTVAALILVCAVGFFASSSLPSLSLQSALLLSYLAFVMVVPTSLWYIIIESNPLSRVGNYSFIKIPFATLLNYLILGEALSPTFYVGAALVAISILLSERPSPN